MNRQKHKLSRRILAVLLMAAMLITMLPSAMFAAPSSNRPGGGDSTQPENAVSIDKTAERVGPDTWNVTMTVEASKEIQSEPLELVLLLDRSGSMAWCTHSDHGYDHYYNSGGEWCRYPDEKPEEDSRQAIAGNAARGLIDQLLDKRISASVSVVGFANNANEILEMTSLTANDAQWIKNQIPTSRASGSTNMNAGLKKADDEFSRNATNKVIIMLADGDYDGDDPNNPWAGGYVSTLKNNKVTVHTIGFTTSNNTLEKIADTTGGNYYTANDADQLADVFTQIAGNLTAMVEDDMGDDVEIVEGSANADNGTVSVSRDGKLSWNPEDGKLGAGQSAEITYTVKLTDEKKEALQAGDNTVHLNGDAVLTYKLNGQGKTYTMDFPRPTDNVEYAKLSVDNYIDGEKSEDSYSDQSAIIYGDDGLTWVDPSDLGEGYTYTGSKLVKPDQTEETITEENFATATAEPGAYTLIHNYTTGLNGTDVTIQVIVNGAETPVEDPLNYVNIDRNTEDTTRDQWELVGEGAVNGILTYDFNYNPTEGKGYDCVDIDVSLTADMAKQYVLQGVIYNESFGSGSPSEVTLNNKDGYKIDNLVGDGNSTADCTIYLSTKYSADYYLDETLLEDKYDDSTAYISAEDRGVTNSVLDQPTESEKTKEISWMNTGAYVTEITLQDLPTKDGYTVNGWYLGSKDGTKEYDPSEVEKVSVDEVLDKLPDLTGTIIPFYATSTLNPKDLTAFNKEVVTSEVDGITGDYQYPEKNGDRYTLTVDEGTEVTLLYKITVEGDAGAEFDVTDKDAKLVKVITADVTIDDTTEDHFTGTIPSGGKVEFYVATDFGAVTADKELKNVASVSNTNGGKDPDDPDEEVTVPVDVTPVYEITSIDKFYISSEKDLTEKTASEIDMSKYAVLDTESEKVIVPNDGTSVTLLYGITVNGTSGATFEVTDTGAELVTYQADEVIDDKAAISGANGVFTGTIPDDGELTFYVSKQFDKDDIKDGNLNNTAAITKGDVEPGKDKDPENVPAEEKATIDSIDKFYVNPEKPGFNKDDTSPAIDLTKYAGLDENGNIVIPENGTVTVLYGITVKGTPGASFYVMDDSASFVAAKTTDTLSDGKSAISGSKDAFTGTFPADGEVTFYVSKIFDADDIGDDGQIDNTAIAQLDGDKATKEDTETNNAIVEETVEIPGDEELIVLIGDKVTVDCVNGNVNPEHPNKVYGLVDKDHYTVSGLTQNASGQPTFTVTLNTDEYIADYSKEIGKEHKLSSDGDYKFTLTWDGNKWIVKPDEGLVIKVECVYGITDFDKFLVANDEQKKATGLTEEELARFTFPDEKGRINLPKDGKVTLLYGITVTGVADEEFTVTDENALLTPDIAPTVKNTDNGIFTGTIPEDGSITFYVEKVFTIDDVKTGFVENEESLVNVAKITDGDVIPGKEDDEEIVPVATGYSLTYEANGGYFANDPAKTTATVGELNPAEYPLWTKDTAVSTIPVDENGKELAKPTHAQAAPPEDTVISDADLVDVELIGWTTEVPEPAGQIYAAGDKYPTLTDKATIEDDNVIVYAVWGYDENNDGVADATQVLITPADITAYTGGTPYGGIADINGNIITETVSGLPEPGYFITLPYNVQQWLNEQTGTTVGATNLHDYMTFTYEGDDGHGNMTTRAWGLEYQGVYETDADGTPLRYVYSLTPATVGDETIPVRLNYFKDTNNNGKLDGTETALTNDDITMSEDLAHDTFSMTINPGELDQSVIKATFEASDEKVDSAVGIGTGTLTVKSVTDVGTTTNAIGNSESDVTENTLTAVANGSVTYYVNDSQVDVDNKTDRVQLLVDSVSNNDDFNAQMGQHAIAEVNGNSDTHDYELAYMDLVDTANGNAEIKLGDNDKLTIYWPMPENADPDGDFQVVHYTDMNREGTVSDLNEVEKEKLAVTKVTVNGKDYLTFEVSSFSPFALVYTADDGSDTPDYPDYPIWTPDGDDDGPSGLNTEDHFSYVVGYAEDYRTGEATDNEDLWPVKPNNQITRAEVATIFYRLLEDEVRDEYDTTTNDFSDVTADSWYNQTVSTLARMGIVKGYEDGSFRPNAPITRAEFGAIATRFFAETGATYEPGTFTDVTGDEWYANAIQDAVNLGLIGGYPDGTVRPNNNITRAEACAIVNRTLGRVPDADHLLPEDVMKVWPDNNPTDWFYADMQEATNGHEYAWIEEDGHEIEEWTNLLDKDWTDR